MLCHNFIRHINDFTGNEYTWDFAANAYTWDLTGNGYTLTVG